MKTYTASELTEIFRLHSLWLQDDLTGKRADLSRANLSGANLSGADLDYSGWPLWCGSLDVQVDDRIINQLAYHLVCLLPEGDARREALKDSANQFHQVIIGACKKL